MIKPTTTIVDQVQPASGFPRAVSDEAIYDQIYGAILEHHLPPQTRLPEDSLGEIFGVSRTRIRKILHRLAHEKILTLLPNRGAFVASPSVEESREVFAARRLLEAGLVEAAVRMATPAALKHLEQCVKKERFAGDRRDHRLAIRLSGEFHLGIAEIIGNSVLTEYLRELVSRTSLIIAVYEAPGRSACNQQEHDELVRLIRSEDAKAAVDAMDRHLMNVEASLNLFSLPSGAVDLRQVFLRASQ
jgi:DNA-binding GntR family transcriptional regulator